MARKRKAENAVAVAAAVPTTAVIAYVMRTRREFEIAEERRNRYRRCRNRVDVLTGHSDLEFREKLLSSVDPEENAVRDTSLAAFFIENREGSHRN